MITPAKIARATMTEEKKKTARLLPFGYYIGRPISYVVTVPFLYTKITPNMVTILSILFALAGFVVNCIFKTGLMLTVGWILFFLWSLFDGVDGNMARYRKQYSKFGDAFDAMGGYICIVCLLFSSGVAAYNVSCVLDSYLPWDKIALIICGGLSAMFNIFPRLMMYYIIATVKNIDSQSAKSVRDKEHYGFIKIIILNLTSPSDFMLLLLLPAIWLHALDIYTYAYFVICFMCMLASLFVMFKNPKNKESNETDGESQISDQAQEITREGE